VTRRFRLWEWHISHFQKYVARRVRELRPSVVVCYDGSARTIFKAARSVGATCVLDQTIGHVKSCIQELATAGVPLHLPVAFLRDAEEEVKAADVIVAGSTYVRDTLLKLGTPSERVVVIPYGVDVLRFQATTRPIAERVQALYVGQIAARKGVQYLVSAFDRVDDPRLELRLVGTLLGDPAWIEGHGPRLNYRASVPHQEIASVYQDADFFVQLSVHEGSSLTIYEALAAGLPVITTPNSGSVVRDGVEGFIVPAHDIDSVVDRMTRLTTDATLRREMSQSARRRAESFTWASYRQRFASLLNVLEASSGKADVIATVLDNERMSMMTEIAGGTHH
jgi:glycosyltransferase involved in cell wall biosynthesis